MRLPAAGVLPPTFEDTAGYRTLVPLQTPSTPSQARIDLAAKHRPATARGPPGTSLTQVEGAAASLSVLSVLTRGCVGALGRIRTCDTRFRKPMLYPLSYEGGAGEKRGRKPRSGHAG